VKRHIIRAMRKGMAAFSTLVRVVRSETRPRKRSLPYHPPFSTLVRVVRSETDRRLCMDHRQ